MLAPTALIVWSLLTLSSCSAVTTEAITTKKPSTTRSTTTSKTTTCGPPPTSTGPTCKSLLCPDRTVTYSPRSFTRDFAGCDSNYVPGSFTEEDTLTFQVASGTSDCDILPSCAGYAYQYEQPDFIALYTFDTSLCDFVWTCQAGKLSPLARYKQDKSVLRFYAYRGVSSASTTTSIPHPTRGI